MSKKQINELLINEDIPDKHYYNDRFKVYDSIKEGVIKNIDENGLYKYLTEYCELYKEKINSNKEEKIKPSLTFLKNKAKTLEDIYNNSKYIIFDEVHFNQDDLKLIDDKAKRIISEFSNKASKVDDLS